VDLLEELKRITTRLSSERIEYALCGGLAMAIYARPRATLDIDIMIELGVLLRTKRAMEELGFEACAELMQFQEGAVQICRMCKIDADSGEELVLDLIIVTPQIREVWENRWTVEWEGGTLDVVSPHGMIVLKAMRGSGQDTDDIEYLRSITDEN